MATGHSEAHSVCLKAVCLEYTDLVTIIGRVCVCVYVRGTHVT